MNDSILLQNLDSEGLKSLLKNVIREELAGIPAKKEEKYFTRKELAGKLHISLPTLDSAIRQKRIKAVRLGGRVLIRESDLELSEFYVRKK